MGMDIAVLGVDLGKNICSVVGLDALGAVVMRRRVRRETLIALAEKLPACIIGMEACCGAHHLGRVFAAHGHDVRLMSPEYVRPYVKAQKNDDRDAEGIAEAATRPTMRFVELKSQDQLAAQVLVAALADSEQLWLAAGGELSRDQTEPCGEIPPTVEALRLTNSGDKRGCDDRADSRDRGQPARLFVLVHPTDKLRVEGRDPSIELGPLRASVGNESDHPLAQSRSALFVHERG